MLVEKGRQGGNLLLDLISEYMCSTNVNNDTEHVDKLRYIAQWSIGLTQRT